MWAPYVCAPKMEKKTVQIALKEKIVLLVFLLYLYVKKFLPTLFCILCGLRVVLHPSLYGFLAFAGRPFVLTEYYQV